MNKKTRYAAINELTLALLYLNSFPDGEGSRFNEISWKGYDFDVLKRLDEEDLIVDQIRRRGGHYKYVYMTEKGRQKARKILSEMGIEDKPIYEKFEFRTIRTEEADETADIEAVCFPPNEACSREHMADRVNAASDYFLVAVDKETGRIAGFLNGIATNETCFRDEFFTDASIHDPEGKNIMLCGLDVLPEYRGQGLARELVFNYCRREQLRGTRRLVLTCNAKKVKMYTKFGFRDLGESASVWGGENWHEMDVILNW